MKLINRDLKLIRVRVRVRIRVRFRVRFRVRDFTNENEENEEIRRKYANSCGGGGS